VAQLYPKVKVKVKIKVMLWPTVSQSVRLGVKFTLELVTRYYFGLKVALLSLWGTLSMMRGRVSLLSVTIISVLSTVKDLI
jgi:hypothetical protein